MDTVQIPSEVQVALVALLGALLGVVASWARQLLRASRKSRQEHEEASAKRARQRQDLVSEQSRAAQLVLLKERRKAYAGLLSSAVILRAVKLRLIRDFIDSDSETAMDASFSGIEAPYYALLTASNVVDLVSDDPMVVAAVADLLFDALVVTAYGDDAWMYEQLSAFDSSRQAFAAAAGDDIYRLDRDVLKGGTDDTIPSA